MRDFAKFAGKYAGEIRAIGSLFGLALRSLPLNPADKSRAVDILDGLERAAASIDESLPRILDGNISRDDLKAIVAEVVRENLPDIIGGATEAAARKGTQRKGQGGTRKPVSSLPPVEAK